MYSINEEIFNQIGRIYGTIYVYTLDNKMNANDTNNM